MDSEGLPTGWCSATLSDVVTLHRGVTYRKPDARGAAEEGFLPLLRANNIDHVINFDDLVFVPERLVSDDQRLRPFDIVIAMSSGSKRLVGKAAQIKTPCDATFGAFCAVARPSDAMEPAFVGWFMQSREYRQSVSDDSKGSNINNLKRDHVLGVPVRVPPLPEQHRIVEKIETLFAELDKGEEALREVQKLLSRYRRSVLKAAVTGELTADWRHTNGAAKETGEELLARVLEQRRESWGGRGKYRAAEPPDTGSLPALPTGWVWASLGQLIASIEAGKNYRCDERPPRDAEHGIVKISAVTWDEFNEDESKTIIRPDHVTDRYRIRVGDLLISRANTLELVGASVVVSKISKRLQLSDKVLRLRCVIPIEHWLNSVLKSPLGRTQIERMATGAQMSMRNISQRNLARICVPLPSQAEITALEDIIADLRSKADQMLEFCEAELSRSAALRQSILKAAFSGELVPQDPTDEPAAKLLERIRAARQEKPTAKRKTVAV
jgi:type I restriction enzyme S subunit